MTDLSYKAAGVDLEVYQQSMQKLPRLIERTKTKRVLPWANGFAGLFQVDFSDEKFKRNYKQPVIVSGTDGVGTKLKVANLANKHDTVGIDLIAMCVNDVICAGAEPLFFLDYVAMSHDDPQMLEQIVTGISEGCVQSGCALLGGETAIMPDLYEKGDYDLAGFCVGIVEKSKTIKGDAIKKGDKIIGVASNGFHSNGYSLVRKVVFEHANLKIDDRVDELGMTVSEALLQPTMLYTDMVKALMDSETTQPSISGLAHNTGGGLGENVGRILPSNVNAMIKRDSWEMPKVFPWLQKLGDLDAAEMYKVFNMGIGFCVIVDPATADETLALINQNNSANFIGEITEGTGEVILG